MHFDFTSALNLVSTVTVIGAFVFAGLQVRAANRARQTLRVSLIPIIIQN